MPFDRPIDYIRSNIIQHTGEVDFYSAAVSGIENRVIESPDSGVRHSYIAIIGGDGAAYEFDDTTPTGLRKAVNIRAFQYTDSRESERLAEWEGVKPTPITAVTPFRYQEYPIAETKIFDPAQIYWRPLRFAVGSGQYQYMDIVPVTTLGRFWLGQTAQSMLSVTNVQIPIGTALSLAEPPYTYLGLISRVERFGYYAILDIDDAGDLPPDPIYTLSGLRSVFFNDRVIPFNEALPHKFNYTNPRGGNDLEALKSGEGFRISFSGGKIPPTERFGFPTTDTKIFRDWDYITQHQTEIKLTIRDDAFGTWAEVLDEGWDQTTRQRFGGDTYTPLLPADGAGATTVQRETFFARKRTYRMPYFSNLRPDNLIIDDREEWTVTDVAEDKESGRKKYNVVEAEILQD